jgi:hypothetical protein
VSGAREWLAQLEPRERRLVGVAAAVAAVVVAAQVALGVGDATSRLGARVAAHEQELVRVRALAARLRRAPAAPARDASLVSAVEEVAAATVGRERIVGMTPATESAGDGLTEERVSLRVSGASLPDVVSLLHALEMAAVPLPVSRLELRKLPDAPTQFAATLDVSRTRRAP